MRSGVERSGSGQGNHSSGQYTHCWGQRQSVQVHFFQCDHQHQQHRCLGYLGECCWLKPKNIIQLFLFISRI